MAVHRDEAKEQPLGRIGLPEEVASVVYFVAVEGTFMSGGLVPCDGGYTAK